MTHKIITGNEAITLGLVRAGANYMASYPITPASSIMNYYLKFNRTFLQTEDEIAAIHSIIGASLAGKRAFTATSGPGFSLMQEGIGLAYVYQAPIVIVNVQRQGPSTGMPTLFSQDTVLQTQYGTHGDHIAIVLSPGNVKEAYYTGILSIYLALKTKSPVVLLSDAYLANLMENFDDQNKDSALDIKIDLPNFNQNIDLSIKPFEPLGTGTRHFTGLCNENGIPKTKDDKVYKKWINSITSSILKGVAYIKPYEYLENKRSNTLIIAYGTLSRLVKSWQDEFSILRPIRLFPVIDDIIKIIKSYENIVLVEGNQGQYKLILEALTHKNIRLISAIGGRIDPDKIYKDIKNE